MSQRVLHRVVFPADRDLDVLPLYVDEGLPAQPPADAAAQRKKAKEKGLIEAPSAPHADWHPDDIVSRRSIKVRPGKRLSLASYFNAFPAAYWRRWTSVEAISLRVETVGSGSVVVYKSNALGMSQRVASTRVEGTATNTWDLTLAPFGDGGWYWFDLIADEAGMVLASAEYSAESDRRVGKLNLGTTTFNRADYCVATIKAVADDPALREILGEFVVVDQGTDTVRNRTEYPGLQEELGPQLTVIEQGNLGGSGGFARNMAHALDSDADYCMLLDDDVLVETEGILRAAAFADHCLAPTIVGGQMFDLHARSVLHAWSEGVDRYKFAWRPVEGTEWRHDFSQESLRRSPQWHKRWDPEYNGWWMCLIPRVVIEEIGLALPVFIKWDDVEYGLRAAAHGFPTVTLPGAAVWHLPWLDKDDTVDWQAYFHVRNRLVTALLYSPFPHGGNVLMRCLALDAKHLYSMQQYANRAHIDALRDVLRGPGHLHETIGVKAAQLRAAKSDFPDATYKPRPSDFPAPGRAASRARRGTPKQPSFATLPLWLVKASARQFFKPAAPESQERPEAILAKQDATFWNLASLDSALVSNAEGTGVSWHKRDHLEARKTLRELVGLYREIYSSWDRLRDEYRAALGEYTSREAWEKTFAANGVTGERR
ncbi:glycosyltransferase [Falsarthrobacter nasiphocae]|uniref:Galactofuranosylgalactofuranosylrhamnosyl-N-acetylglucosaminyl-diphospho-decaprenol beta-1,5/1,6-galactofuranosyltransferase n=1 Tax=Falsarthrobacter nasiphocae TaxID=189863 RepID=A0AAE4C5E1_9MICC|nr:glycosyltransferase [Falsarthrobacter nasiphocae]MDR6891413.1 galactofuranosylgalactofuranosylrhamnosyl-N-acetylglucosaminyl-diphospho-decaprenol beta-1,5/1,6-galactofuranosyltransferase [Falsarthrobacter nasiphocae]